MAKRAKKGPNKCSFVRDFITSNPEANRRAVEEAWLAAGHEGVISSALVSNLSAKLGLTGNLPKQSNAEAKSDTTSAPTIKKPGKPKGATGKLRRRKPEQAAAEANGTTAVLGAGGKNHHSSGDRSVATGRGGNEGKTAFVTEYLQKNPDANDDEINEAWAAAGNEGGISGSLLYKIRAKRRGAGKRGRARSSDARWQSSPRVGRTPESVTETPKPLDGRTHRGRSIGNLRPTSTA